MPFLPNIFNRGSQQTQQTAAPQPAVQNPAPAPAGNSVQAPEGQQGSGLALDKFAHFFKPAPAATSQPAAGQQQQQQQQQQPKSGGQNGHTYLPALDNEAFSSALSGHNFAAGVNPELVQTALGGDPTAFMEVLNSVARNAFTASAHFAHSSANSGAHAAYERFSGEIDSRVRDHGIRTQNYNNPALQHEAAKPMVEAFKTMLASKDPTLTPQQVQEQAENYFLALNESISGQQTKTQEASAPRQKNWLEAAGVAPKPPVQS